MILQKVKALLAIARDKSAIYIRGEGATCPVCKFLGLPFRRVASYKTDGSVKYHRCGECGTGFKSICAEPKLSKIPETNDKPKKKPHIKNRRS